MSATFLGIDFAQKGLSLYTARPLSELRRASS